MLIYILKSSACLVIFMIFYKSVLEKTSIHKFKRFYLLSALLLAIVIPLITFTKYIEPVITDFQIVSATNDVIINDTTILENNVNYLPIILSFIYGLGVLFFLIKFCLNLNRLMSIIKHNPKYRVASFINVLIENLTVPHTFFNYIFFNKKKFETNKIPSEVILHEQAHARQKHSIDIIVLELLQILFWFNPLIYLVKKDIKLNHEFLADSEVLKHGIEPSAYQNIILAFSSKATNNQLANAINYSSIKKRFTVMKTQTSKTSVWLRSLLIIPLIALTLLSFSVKVEIEREYSSKTSIQESVDNSAFEKEVYYQNATFLFKNKNGKVIASKRYSELTQEEKDRLFLPIRKTEKKSPTQSDLDRWKDSKTYGVWFDNKKIDNNSLNTFKPSNISLFNESKLEKNAINYGEYFNQVNLYSNIYFNKHHKNDKAYSSKSFVVTIIQDEAQKGATTKQLAEYNKLAKHYNAQPKDKRIIKKKDIERLEMLYKVLNNKQKKSAEPFPECPPPPPAVNENNVNTGFIKIKGVPHYFVNNNNKIKYYNRKGFEVSKTGKVLSKSQVNASDVIPGQYITKIYTNDEVVAEFKNNKPNLKGELNIPPPPKTPKTPKVVKEKKTTASPKTPKPEKIEVKKKKSKVPKVVKKDKSQKWLEVKEILEAPKQKNKVAINETTPPLDSKSSLDLIKELSKKGAFFYLEGQNISTEKAIKTVTNNKKINIQVREVNSERPIVRLSKNPIGIETVNINKHDQINNKLNNSESSLKFVTDMTKDDTLRFCYNGKTITRDRAIRIAKNNPNVHIRLGIEYNTGQNIIYLSKRKPLIGYKG